MSWCQTHGLTPRHVITLNCVCVVFVSIFHNERNEKQKNSHPQLERGGAERPQAAGRVAAFVTFKTTPRLALFLRESQRQVGDVFRTVFKPEQHAPDGLVMVLSFETNDKQSAMMTTMVEQSAEGDGASRADEALGKSTAQMTKMQRMNENFEAMMKNERLL